MTLTTRGNGTELGGIHQGFANINNINVSNKTVTDANEFLSGTNNQLAPALLSIRRNVSRVLQMYFQNVSDENGYGAATTTQATTTTTTQATTGGLETATPTQSSRVSDVLNSTVTAVHSHLVNITKTRTDSTTTNGLTLNSTQVLTTAPSIIYPSYSAVVRNNESCSALFGDYTQPQQGTFCNWTWDLYLCWPPTPAGVLARMNCPSGWHGVDTRKFANRKCELDGHWGGRPNETYNPVGWTNFQPCYKPEVSDLMQKMTNPDLLIYIAQRTRTLEIVGFILSLFALILSLIIFCNFRSLRNNRTKIHKNLFIAMVLQVTVRLTVYLDQAFRRGKQVAATNTSLPGIETTPYLCEASYVLLEYARTAMFMWMFIEGLYLHNMVTVAVFHGRFPLTLFSLLGWGIPVLMTTAWAMCTAAYMDGVQDCFWNYNLMPYYWILEGPRLIVILLNFFFLMNIIRVLVVKLRQSQASDIEQTRKAVRAAIVLLPLLGITNLLQSVPPALDTAWKFALWSYVTHFLTSFQGFFIALIYCFLNGEVRTVLLKSLAVYMSVRGHPEWVPKRASMFSGAYNTAADTEGQLQHDVRRNESPPSIRLNGRKPSNTVKHATSSANAKSRTHITRRPSSDSGRQRHSNNNNGRDSWLTMFCFRGGQKNKCVMSTKNSPPKIFVTPSSLSIPK